MHGPSAPASRFHTRRLRSLPLPAQLYVVAVVAVGATLVAAVTPRATFEQPWLFVSLLILSVVASAFKVYLPLADGGSTMSVSYAIDFTALILLGAHETMLIAVASAWTQCTFRLQSPNPVHRTLFSMACLAVTVQAAGRVYTLLGGVPGSVGPAAAHVAGPLVGAALAYFICNTLLIAIAIALSTEHSVVAAWRQNFLWSAPSYFVGAAVALGAAWALLHSGIWIALLLAAPLYLTYYTYRVYLGRLEDERRHVGEMADLHLATIEALALAIDAKDQTAHAHIRRVQVYAAGLAKALGMPDHDIQGVKTAALLHDIGKLAVPEHILSKPGPLTHDEFQKIRAHPRVGADIISAVPFPYPVAPLILSHHERWDGKGYPRGLTSEEIPLGARILSVVDHFDAMTSDRPYHKAMTQDAALTLLRQEIGKAHDPTVVHTFIRLLPELSARALRVDDTPRRLTLAPASDEGRGVVAPVAIKPTSVLEDIAHAHREIYGLYEIAQTMGTSLGVSDTMSLIASKLISLVPFTSCALFLFDDERQMLRCRFATGAEAEVMTSLTLGSGQGLSGWVARNKRPLLNARPSADFEAGGLSEHATVLESALVSPLVFHDKFIGTLALYHAQPQFYTDDHRRLLERVSTQASAVINNSITFEQTQADSLTDALTGLPNTRFMFMHLSRELARAERLKSEVALLVMDLDNFKEINDHHGHHTGDRALAEVAAVLRKVIRPYDMCVRYAGDEFIMVLPGCGVEEAERKRLEAQRTVDAVSFEVKPGRAIPLAISIGASVFPHDGETYEALLATADSRMYRDKTRRKRQPTLQPRATGTDGRPVSSAASYEPTDIEIQRAGIGLL